ncbi:MAG: hypothetical protein O3C54_05430 [Proteobacteria bacterium]|nr:hypothetical protein [Pseudomonadota bacterium]
MLRSRNIFIVVLCFILVIGCAESKPKIPDPSSAALSYVKATSPVFSKPVAELTLGLI